MQSMQKAYNFIQYKAIQFNTIHTRSQQVPHHTQPTIINHLFILIMTTTTATNNSNNKKRKSSEQDTTTTSTATATAANNHTTKQQQPQQQQPPLRKKKTNNTHSNKSQPSNGNDPSSSTSSSSSFEPYTLSQIRDKITSLTERIPSLPPSGLDPTHRPSVKSWAVQMHATIEEFNLLLSCVSAATYKWGTDRSGAADQNLVLLSNELNNTQDQISTSISPKLSNVLAPSVDLVTKETVTTREGTKNQVEAVEKKVHYFAQEESDPAFIQLCIEILCRNAVMLRHVLLTNFHKVGRCIDDYLKATSKDGEGRGNMHYSF